MYTRSKADPGILTYCKEDFCRSMSPFYALLLHYMEKDFFVWLAFGKTVTCTCEYNEQNKSY